MLAIQLELLRKNNKLRVTDPQSVSSLVNGCYGNMEKGVIYLYPEEALYLMDIRNGKCFDEHSNLYTFNDVASLFLKDKKLMAKYFTYKSWRDRGLIARPAKELDQVYDQRSSRKYPGGKLKLDRYSLQGLFFEDDLVTIIDDQAVGRDLYEKYWIGQFGSYKAEQRGNLSKLDIYETLFMLKHSHLSISNAKEKDIFNAGRKQHEYFDLMYEVYEDWRLKDYILKTGFKFGTHFRLYFPGAGPTKKTKEWIHSKHVIHVFPKKSTLLISEWSRAIRVAHSVRKTFILAIPGKKTKKKKKKLKTNLDFLLYHRKKGNIEKPGEGKPKYLMFSISEEEYLGGSEFSKAFKECEEAGLELLLAIADRETSVTYYLVKKIDLPNSRYEYYEIEWIQP